MKHVKDYKKFTKVVGDRLQGELSLTPKGGA